MRLLYVSISHDGYTQPVVTVYDPDLDKYVIVDGFHRYTTMRRNKDLYDLNEGRLPIVVLQKTMNERMAATIRHNRARGKHSVAGMGQIVFNMLKNGATDEAICNEVGLEPEELARLKYVTGFAKLFENAEFGKAWETDRQLAIRKAYTNGEPIPSQRK
jgi:ParB-like chromosome segregation protein Spo0J